MKTKIFYTENAGVYLQARGAGILIDGIHDAGKLGFSPMPEEEMRQIELREGVFKGLDTLLFSHQHKDHYCAEKVRKMMERYPNLAVWGPGLESRHLFNYREEENSSRFSVNGFTIYTYRTEHSGMNNSKEPHMSILMRSYDNDDTVLVSGDAVFYPDLAEKIWNDVGKVNIVFVMLYQLLEKSSLQFLKTLNPGRILLYHLPAPEDEMNHYRILAEHVLHMNPIPGYIIEIPEYRSRVL